MNRLLAVPDQGADTPAGPPWITDALCRNFTSELDLWFPEKEFPSTTAQAREVCGRCPVARQCLEYALGFTGHRAPRGVWGATTTNERARIRQRTIGERAA